MKAKNDSILRELEKTVISLEGQLKKNRENAFQDRICTQWVAKMRKKYGFTAKSWTQKKPKEKPKAKAE